MRLWADPARHGAPASAGTTHLLLVSLLLTAFLTSPSAVASLDASSSLSSSVSAVAANSQATGSHTQSSSSNNNNNDLLNRQLHSHDPHHQQQHQSLQQQQQQPNAAAASSTSTSVSTSSSASAASSFTPPPPQLTIVQLTTFKDFGRAFASIASVRRHLAPELLREMIMLSPWQEYLVLRNSLTPTLGGRPCRPECYHPASAASSAPSKVAEALAAAKLLLPAADAGAGSPQECLRCGPPLWVVPEHLALGVARKEMAAIDIYGYRLQMVLKMTVSSFISTSHYLVLDSDVLMVRPVGPQHAHWLFPLPGRALFQPQRRLAHRTWWDATESLLRLGGCLSADPETRVFGVTPAILARDLATETVRYWDAKLGGGSRIGALRRMLPRDTPFYTEYCSYHLVAECWLGRGTLERYHAPRGAGLKGGAAAAVAAAAVGPAGKNSSIGYDVAPKLYNGLWRKGSGNWSAPGGKAKVCTDCLFLVVQSNAGVPERRIVDDLEELFV